MRPPLLIKKTVLLVICCVTFSAAFNAQVSFNQPQSPFTKTVWTTEDGLPQNTVTGLVQSSDGYMWIGTFGGLVRFDGTKFKIFNTINAPAIKTNRILDLSADKTGTLWITTQTGNVITYRDGKFTLLNLVGAMRSSFADHEGGLWGVSAQGLSRYLFDAAGEIVSETLIVPDPNIGVVSFAEDEADNIWIATSTKLYQYHNGSTNTFAYSDALPTLKDKVGSVTLNQFRIVVDGKDNLWLAHANGLLRFDKRGFVIYVQQANGNVKLAQGVDGNLIFSVQDNIYQVKDDQTFAVLIDHAAQDANLVRMMLSDREGSIWLGFTGKGLVRYKRRTAWTYTKADDFTNTAVGFVFEDKEKNIWLGADGLYRFRDGRFEHFSDGPTGELTCHQGRDGTLWFGGNNKLFSYRDGKLTERTKDFDTPANPLFEDSQGTLWFSESNGVAAVRDGKREVFTKQNGFPDARSLPTRSIQAVIEDKQGAVWFGTTLGAARYKDGRFTSFTTQDGLSNDNIRDIYEDRDGAIWFATYGGGLNRFKDGKFFPITTREGLYEDIVSRIIADNNDSFWMLGNRGVYTISRSALNDLADGKIYTIACAAYNVSDGMLNSEGNGGNYPAGWRASDGKLWFPSIEGVIVIDPQQPNTPPPPVFIEEVYLAGQQLDETRTIEVAPGKENLEIRYTGLNFSKPEQVKFRYKLEGLDKDWVEVGTRRIAYYAYLPAGRYHFTVTAANPGSGWNEQTASIEVVVIVTPIWKKSWFIVLISLLVIVAIALFFRLRYVQLETRRREQEAFSRQLLNAHETERKRIAAELHDGLGQHLIVIKNWAALGLKFSEEDAPVREQLNEISSTSLQAINEVREIVYDLRPYQLETIGLTNTVKFMVESLSASSGINFNTAIDPIDNTFTPEDEVTFYRIIQECVSNIVKHSQATTASVEIKKNENVGITIKDNGKGFAVNAIPQPSKRAGFGLQGLNERVRMIGGTQEIQSEKENGTTVIISIDLEKNKRRLLR